MEYQETPDIESVEELLVAAREAHCRSVTIRWLEYLLHAKWQMRDMRAQHGYDEHGAKLK